MRRNGTGKPPVEYEDDFLRQCSPFEAGSGRHCNLIQYPFGPEVGFMKLWRHGRLEIHGNHSEDDGEPCMVLIPEDAEILMDIARDLAAMEEQYAAWCRENPEQAAEDQRSRGNFSSVRDPSRQEPEPPKPAPPTIVKINGAAAQPALAEWAAK
jgi:hypothetical protein